MDERVKKILDKRTVNEQIEAVEYMIKQKLYDTEYIDDLGKNYKDLSSEDYIRKVNDIGIYCLRVNDNKAVAIERTSNSELSRELKKYKVMVPLDVPIDLLIRLVEGDDKKTNNKLSANLILFSNIFYVISFIFAIIWIAQAADVNGPNFIFLIPSIAVIVFLGLALHALSYILNNLISINKKIK